MGGGNGGHGGRDKESVGKATIGIPIAIGNASAFAAAAEGTWKSMAVWMQPKYIILSYLSFNTFIW